VRLWSLSRISFWFGPERDVRTSHAIAWRQPRRVEAFERRHEIPRLEIGLRLDQQRAREAERARLGGRLRRLVGDDQKIRDLREADDATDHLQREEADGVAQDVVYIRSQQLAEAPRPAGSGKMARRQRLARRRRRRGDFEEAGADRRQNSTMSASSASR